MVRWRSLVVWLGLAAVACGGPSVAPIGDTPDDTSAGGPVDGCRPPLGEDDPHPLEDGGNGDDPALAGEWVDELAAAIHTQHTDVLGGLWLDQDAGEVVIMVPSTDGRAVFERLRADVPRPERVVCMAATHTEDDLRSLQEQVTERLHGSAAFSTSVDTIRNRVDVGFEGDAEAARASLGDLADHEAVVVTVPDCAAVSPPPEGATPLPGGGSNCSGMEALLTGTLVGDPSAGCAWIEDEAGQPTAVVWPRGWSLTHDGTVLDHRGEARASIGDRVESAGGHVPLPEGERVCGTGGDDGAWAVGDLARADEARSEGGATDE